MGRTRCEVMPWFSDSDSRREMLTMQPCRPPEEAEQFCQKMKWRRKTDRRRRAARRRIQVKMRTRKEGKEREKNEGESEKSR